MHPASCERVIELGSTLTNSGKVLPVSPTVIFASAPRSGQPVSSFGIQPHVHRLIIFHYSQLHHIIPSVQLTHISLITQMPSAASGETLAERARRFLGVDLDTWLSGELSK
jgi:hypothetical protein